MYRTWENDGKCKVSEVVTDTPQMKEGMEDWGGVVCVCERGRVGQGYHMFQKRVGP